MNEIVERKYLQFDIKFPKQFFLNEKRKMQNFNLRLSF